MFANVLTQLGINSTLWTQLAVFAVLYIFLRVVYFQPFLKLIAERERASTGSEKETQDLLKKIEANEASYNQKLRDIRRVAKENSEKILNKVKLEAAEKVAATRQKNKEALEAGRSQLNTNFSQSLSEADKQVSNLSELMIEKLVETKVGL